MSPRDLPENITRSWRGMEDAHHKIPKYFLLDGCLLLSFQILRLGYLYSGYIYIYKLYISYLYFIELDRYYIERERYLDILIIDMCKCIYIPVIPHKAVAEVSKIGNL